jgi:GT2 family glycosyltransferase
VDRAAKDHRAPLAGLPGPLRGLLLQGGTGKPHLARAAGLAREPADDAWPGLARALYLAAWECDPLDGALAGAVLSLPGEPLAPALAETLAFVRDGSSPPADLKYFSRLAERRDHAKLRHFLGQQRSRQPQNLFWLGHELTHMLATDDFGPARELVLREFPARLSALTPKLLGDLALCLGEPEAALAHYGDFARVYDGPASGLARAKAHALRGDAEAAAKQLARTAAAHPWCVNAALILHDLAAGRAAGVARLPEPAAVLLYTFNKAAEIELTLASLERGLAGLTGQIARVIVLDNGSSDQTPEILRAAADRLGPDVFRVVRLPVNVGAPAARNWLAREPEVRGSRFTVYLDDDVDLPPDWLGRLAYARERYPGAGVWGCKVVDHYRPLQIQSADLHLEALAQTGEDQETHATPRRFAVSGVHHQVLDFGQFAYLRPCASVTGCLHLFETGRLGECGDFDLRFSPSQFDDLDHDFRLLLSGAVPVYQGHLGLPHLKRTGATGMAGGAGYSLGFANQYKLNGKYSPEDFARMAQTAETAVLNDFLSKWTWLHEARLIP